MSNKQANNSLPALNDMLFQQIEALTNPDLNKEELDKEIERSKAVSQISKQIIHSAALQLKAAELATEYSNMEVPQNVLMIDGNRK